MIPFLILLPHLKANLVNFNCGLTESKYIFEFNDVRYEALWLTSL